MQATLRRSVHISNPLRVQRPQRTVQRPRTVSVQARFGGNSGGPDVAQRVVAAIPYLMPLLDGLKYSKFFWKFAPQMKIILLPLEPLVQLFYGVPFASFVAFLAIYYFIVNNTNFSRFVRFNAMQAVMLDIILVFPSLVEMVVGRPTSGAMLNVYIMFYNTIWIFVLVSVAYGIGSALSGQWGRLPLISDAAENQVR